eukprot:COSAG03_NODE_378_length_8385_cov_5.999638_7_plen_158_part_00
MEACRTVCRWLVEEEPGAGSPKLSPAGYLSAASLRGAAAPVRCCCFSLQLSLCLSVFLCLCVSLCVRALLLPPPPPMPLALLGISCVLRPRSLDARPHCASFVSVNLLVLVCTGDPAHGKRAATSAFIHRDRRAWRVSRQRYGQRGSSARHRSSATA